MLSAATPQTGEKAPVTKIADTLSTRHDETGFVLK